MAADKISIGDSCMFGHGACITDADWHGIYDRTKVVGDPKPVVLEENVWVGEDAMICKGVRIGANSIIGARSVVTKDVPNNTIYAGNPATFIRNLDDGQFITRKDFFKDLLNWLMTLIYLINTHLVTILYGDGLKVLSGEIKAID